MVHRDIKPENIMIADSGEAKVLDFGIARLLTQSGGGLTSTGVVIGTPPYLAPECWSGAPIDGRADLYALGVVLFQLCTGQRPFNAGSPVTMMYQHLNDPPPPVHTPDPALAVLVRQLLAKDPADRPADAAEVRRRLREVRLGPEEPSAEVLRRRADQAWQHGADGRRGGRPDPHPADPAARPGLRPRRRPHPAHLPRPGPLAGPRRQPGRRRRAADRAVRGPR